MKTYNLICILFLVCSCTLSCKGRRRRHNPPALPPPEFVNAGKAIEEMGRQIRSFTEQSTRHFQAMGTAINDVLKMMSENTARGINLMEQQVKEMKEHSSAQLHAITQNVKAIYSQFLERVINVQEAVYHINMVVRKSHNGLEIVILILVLLLYLVTRYLRLHTKNDPISLVGIVILSFVELAVLVYAVQLSANILHRHFTEKDIDRKTLLQVAFGTVLLIILVICIPFVPVFLSTWVLPFIVWCVKTPLLIARKFFAIWSFLLLCIVVLTVLAYHSPELMDQTIVLSVVVVLLGVFVKAGHAYLAESKPPIAPKPVTTKIHQDKIRQVHQLDHADKLRKRQLPELKTLQANRKNSF